MRSRARLPRCKLGVLRMRIFVNVKPNARQEKVEKIDETHFRVWIKAPPQEGKANRAVIEVMSEYLNVPKSRLVLSGGLQSRNKVIQLT